jgi:hypothetical protein
VMPMVLRGIAAIAAVSVLFTLVLIATIVGPRGVGPLMRAGPLGVMTIIGWVVTIVIGPYAAVQLWRLSHRGRIAGLSLFAFGAAYYLAGLFWLRAPDAQSGQIIAAAIAYAVPMLVLASPQARRACS